jgi:cytochrome c biogenesis factor
MYLLNNSNFNIFIILSIYFYNLYLLKNIKLNFLIYFFIFLNLIKFNNFLILNNYYFYNFNIKLNINLMNGFLLIHPILLYLFYAFFILLIFFYFKKINNKILFKKIKSSIIKKMLFFIFLAIILGSFWAVQELN